MHALDAMFLVNLGRTLFLVSPGDMQCGLVANVLANSLQATSVQFPFEAAHVQSLAQCKLCTLHYASSESYVPSR